jgi:hypothetical protein
VILPKLSLHFHFSAFVENPFSDTPTGVIALLSHFPAQVQHISMSISLSPIILPHCGQKIIEYGNIRIVFNPHESRKFFKIRLKPHLITALLAPSGCGAGDIY